MLDLASFLKRSANLLVMASIVKLVFDDLRSEVRQDADFVRTRTAALLRRSPYGAAGTAAALGVLAGLLLNRPARRGHAPY